MKSSSRQFIAAVFLAALYGRERFGWRAMLASGWAVARTLTARRGKVSKEIYDARMRHCEQCAIFDTRLLTCGSPLSDNPELGCWCHQPFKNTQPEATCWMDDHLGDKAEFGWKKAGVK